MFVRKIYFPVGADLRAIGVDPYSTAFHALNYGPFLLFALAICKTRKKWMCSFWNDCFLHFCFLFALSFLILSLYCIFVFPSKILTGFCKMHSIIQQQLDRFLKAEYFHLVLKSGIKFCRETLFSLLLVPDVEGPHIIDVRYK